MIITTPGIPAVPFAPPRLVRVLPPQPIPWTLLENALYDFFTLATGLNVQWEDQKAPRPVYPYGTLRVLSGPHPLGLDEIRVESVIGGLKPAKLIACGSREAVVSFKIFGAPGSVDPERHARAYAGVIVAALGLPVYRDVLTTGGLAIRQIMPLTLPDQQVGDTFVSRAVIDVRFGLSSNFEQPIDVIESAHIKAVGAGLGSLPPSLIIDQTFGGT